MHSGKSAARRRIWIGTGIVLGITCAWLVWTRGRPAVLVGPAPAKQPFVRVAGVGTGVTDQLLRERTELYDPTPLFFPTEWNYDQGPLPESMSRQPEQVFGSFGANFTFTEQNISLYGSRASTETARPADILVRGNEAPFAGIGRIDVVSPALPQRGGFLEIKALSDGKVIVSQSLNDSSIPRSDFGPMEFLIVVSSSGIIGEPVLMTEAGLEEVDEEVDVFFRSYLVNFFRLGERLSPGRYRVLVGP